MKSKAVIASFLACWRVQDVESALGHLHDEIVYTLHNGPDAEPFAGTYRGIECVRALAYDVLAEFDYLSYEPTIINECCNVAQVHVAFRIRHRVTGDVIEGTQRSVFGVRDGVIASVDIYEDTARLEAFMRLLAQRMASRAHHPDDVGIAMAGSNADAAMKRIFGRIIQREPGRR